MNDPRVVEPQRLAAAGETCEHRYWCGKRITGVAVLAVLLVALVTAVLRWWA